MRVSVPTHRARRAPSRRRDVPRARCAGRRRTHTSTARTPIARRRIQPASVRAHPPSRRPIDRGSTTGPVRREMHDGTRGPRRLEDRLGRSAGDELRIAWQPRVVELGDPELAAVPRHVGLVPRQPQHASAVRADPRRRVEVVARHERDRLAAVERDRAKIVDHSRTAVVLDDADEPVSRGVHLEVGVAELGARTGVSGSGPAPGTTVWMRPSPALEKYTVPPCASIAAPPYSCTQVRAEYGASMTSVTTPSCSRTMTHRPRSTGRPSIQ